MLTRTRTTPGHRFGGAPTLHRAALVLLLGAAGAWGPAATGTDATGTDDAGPSTTEPASTAPETAATAGHRHRPRRGRRAPVVLGGQLPAPQAVQPAADASVMPTRRSPPVVSAGGRLPGAKPRPVPRGLVGSSHALALPPVVDRRRRHARTKRPDDYGHTLRPGERFRFDVSFAGNPAGLAEASIIGVEPDPRGGPPGGAPMVRIEGHARTSGVVSLLATVTDDMVTYVDAKTGAAITSHNVLHYSGIAPRKYKHRDTKHAYEGRGQVRIVDAKDDDITKKLHRAPNDTYDPLSIMAWVRSLRLEKGERVKAHVVDGLTLMRVEIESQGRDRLDPMPSMVAALGLEPTDVIRIDGTITRVDEYGAAIPGKKSFRLRAWLSADERRVPLVMESDLWVGSIRLVLSGYDPPTSNRAVLPPRGDAATP